MGFYVTEEYENTRSTESWQDSGGGVCVAELPRTPNRLGARKPLRGPTRIEGLDYDAFGNIIAQAATDPISMQLVVVSPHDSTLATPNSYLYCGEQYDHDLGLYFLRARYMDTTRGRFWSMDTFEGIQNSPMTLHKYLYANANPVSFSDPSGRFSLPETMFGVFIWGWLAEHITWVTIPSVEHPTMSASITPVYPASGPSTLWWTPRKLGLDVKITISGYRAKTRYTVIQWIKGSIMETTSTGVTTPVKTGPWHGRPEEEVNFTEWQVDTKYERAQQGVTVVSRDTIVYNDTPGVNLQLTRPGSTVVMDLKFCVNVYNAFLVPYNAKFHELQNPSHPQPLNGICYSLSETYP